MGKQACKQCGKIFKYCGACAFKTIYYHEEGFCSDECCAKYRLGTTQKESEPIVLVGKQTEPTVVAVEVTVAEVIPTSIEEESVEVKEKEIPKQVIYKNKNKWDTRVVN